MNTGDQASLLSLSLRRLRRHPRPPQDQEPRPSLFKKGRNVWQVSEAKRVATLVDGDAFFRAFTEAVLKAEKQVFIIGWDIDSRTVLPHPENLPGDWLDSLGCLHLGTLLARITELRPDLRVNILTWDYAFIYIFERESLASVKFSAMANGRLHFVLDKKHPTLAAHHQKVVVIDDLIAFSGGLDLTQRRWDTPEHIGHDNRRVDPGGHAYGPFHDVQICFDGPAARAIGDLARERWLLATGERIEPPETDNLKNKRPWPESARVAFEKI
jgi:phospholipase D1/2